MLSRILKGAAATALVAVVGGALLYVAGLRIVIYGDRHEYVLSYPELRELAFDVSSFGQT